MTLILHILKKDLRSLWPLLLAWWAVLALETAFPAWLLFAHSQIYLVEVADLVAFLNLALLIADLALVVVIATGLIDADSPVNDRAFWRTLPLARGHMFVAKGLFALLFLVLPASALFLATKMIYGFPPAEWFDGFAFYAVERACLAVFALAVPGIFRRPIQAYIGIAAVGVGLEFLVGLFPGSMSTEAPYFWINGGELAAFMLVIPGACALIGAALFMRKQREVSRLPAAAGMLLAGVYLRMILGLNGNAFANLDSARGAVELLPLLLGGVAASLFIYSRFQPYRGALILPIGLFATINVIAWGPAPELNDPDHPKPELLQLPPGNTITARGMTDFQANGRPGTRGRPNGGRPELELLFENKSSGNLSIFDLDKTWHFGYTVANLRWPDGQTIIFGGDGADEGRSLGEIDFLLKGRTQANPVPPPQTVGGTVLRIANAKLYARLQHEPAIIEGHAKYTDGSIEKVADLPLVSGATSSLGPNRTFLRKMETGSQEDNGRLWSYASLSVAMLSPQRVENLYGTGHFTSPEMLFVLWNPAHQEYFEANFALHRSSVSTVVNADFAENGVTFNLGSYELEAYLYGAVSPINGRDPMTPPEAAAWLAGARLLAFRFTPHPYYLPFKTEPFILQTTPPAAP